MFTAMLPPQLHIHLQLSSSAGKFEIISLPPGIHGAAITGMQGMGVSTPLAAAVAAATCGLAIDWHMPKGMMFTIGLLSMMLAIGFICTLGRMGSITMNADGATPKLHFSNAPAQTNFPILFILLFYYFTIFTIAALR